MTDWQIFLFGFCAFGCLSLLLSLTKQLEKLITEVRHLRIEYRNATGVEPAGMTLARQRGEERRWSEEVERKQRT